MTALHCRSQVVTRFCYRPFFHVDYGMSCYIAHPKARMQETPEFLNHCYYHQTTKAKVKAKMNAPHTPAYDPPSRSRRDVLPGGQTANKRRTRGKQAGPGGCHQSMEKPNSAADLPCWMVVALGESNHSENPSPPLCFFLSFRSLGQKMPGTFLVTGWLAPLA